MKKFFCAFMVVLLYTSLGIASTDTSHRFSGTWNLNGTNGYFGGSLEIYNCTSTKCDFKLQSWYDQHICDADGQIELKSPTIGVYNTERYMYDQTKDLDYSVPVGINFELLSDGGLSLKYTTPDSHGAFCGMSATVDGVWHNP